MLKFDDNLKDIIHELIELYEYENRCKNKQFYLMGVFLRNLFYK